MTSYATLADIIFPDAKPLSYRQEQFPKRPQDCIVTRIAPSPTGFMHIGAIYTGLINQHFAKQSQGVFILRIEDTDQKREVTGAIDLIIGGFESFGIHIDEGPIGDNGKDIGAYGPYIQSLRKEIYHSFAKHLIAEGKAYPCWMSSEKLDLIREEQTKTKKIPGIYGNYSERRHRTVEEYIEQYQKDTHCVIRYRSYGDIKQKIIFEDINRGSITMTDNYNDNVLIKANDGLPTYHLAHITDDYLMGTTHVIRGEERLTSVPWHLQLFGAFGFTPPIYCHLPSILKNDEGKKRKLSKRHDPESGVNYLFSQGYHPEVCINYLLSIIDSGFEPWYESAYTSIVNTNKIIGVHKDYHIVLENISSSGALFDYKKLNRRSNKFLSGVPNDTLYTIACERAKKYDQDGYTILTKDPENVQKAIAIERHTDHDPKRFHILSDISQQVSFIYDNLREEKISTDIIKSIPSCITNDIIQHFIDIYRQKLNITMTKEEWFEQLKSIGSELGFAGSNQEFKDGGYIGKIGDLAMFLRIGLSGETKTPDLYNMIQLLGKDKVIQRLGKILI